MSEMTKRLFLERLRAGRAEWLALLEQVAPERRDAPGVVGQWSVRQLVGHVAAWETWGANVAQAITAGGEPQQEDLFGVVIPPEIRGIDFDTFNIWLTDRYARRTYDEVCADERAAYWRFVAAFETLREDDLPRPCEAFPVVAGYGDMPLWELMAGQSFDHYAEHAVNVRAWLGAHETKL